MLETPSHPGKRRPQTALSSQRWRRGKMRPISWHTSCLDMENFNGSHVLMFLFYVKITNWEYIKSVVGSLSTLLKQLARSGCFAWYTCYFSHHHPKNVVKHIFQMGVSTNTLWCLLGVLAWCLLPSCGFCTFCQVCLIAVWRWCLEFEKPIDERGKSM